MSVRSLATKDLRYGSSVFFLIICIMLGSNKIRKVKRPFFSKNVPTGQDSLNCHENAPKMRFCGFWKKSNQFICTFFLLAYDSANDLLTFLKVHVTGEKLVHELWSRNFQTNQSAGFFKLECSTNELNCRFEFLYVIRYP